MKRLPLDRLRGVIKKTLSLQIPREQSDRLLSLWELLGVHDNYGQLVSSMDHRGFQEYQGYYCPWIVTS